MFKKLTAIISTAILTVASLAVSVNADIHLDTDSTP